MDSTNYKESFEKGITMKVLVLSVFIVIYTAAVVFSEELYGKAIFIDDGDTFILSSHNQKFRVRLANIDAPEKSQEYGEISKNALLEKILRKNVRVLYYSSDKYGRIIGTVYVDSRNINYEMVLNGHAWAYRKYLHDTDYIKAEGIAFKKKRGLWRYSNPIPPEEYRHMNN